MEHLTDKILKSTLIAGFIIFIFSTVYFPKQSDFPTLFLFISISFGFYTLLYINKNIGLKTLIAVGIFTRISLMILMPNLSDDVFRFIWDGRLWHQGINPYSLLPDEVLNLSMKGLSASLYDQLNSQSYYTVYPPVAQLVFYLSTFTESILLSTIIMKFIFILGEIIGLIYILKLLGQQHKSGRIAMLYFLNPLILLEGAGNLHFEILMIGLFAAGLYYYFYSGHKISALFMAASVATKLIPLMFVPYFLLTNQNRKKSIYFIAWGIGFTTILFIPLMYGLQFQNFFESIDLYFRKFEFNASVYYLFRAAGQWIVGYNLIKYIGPALGLITLCFIIYQAKKTTGHDIKNFAGFGLISMTAYLILGTTIHPWYLSFLIFFGMLTSRLYPFVWSWLIFLSYSHYADLSETWKICLIALEYTILTVVIWYESYILRLKEKF
ncbi:MAG: DUF2029 domain-containing protein [Saprospiraceae bacterium]|nr:DUF2029 domain-containing protein [Saprospiraceae bacterium]